jgi:hypothetical protein
VGMGMVRCPRVAFLNDSITNFKYVF